MSKINIGYYLTPHVWIGSDKNILNATELATILRSIAPGIDLAIQRQGLVLASVNTDQIPDYRPSDASNVIRSETASFILNFFNAFSFAFYEAQLVKAKGGFGSVPQEVALDDLYYWPASEGSVEEINKIQPGPICSGEFDTFFEGVNKLRKTAGHLSDDELKMRWDIDPSIFNEHLDKRLMNNEMMKLLATLNRGIVAIRGASFDVALISFWTVIESIMKDLWSRLLIEKGVSRDRRKFLIGRDITASILSESLNLHGIIGTELYNNISESRKARNKLMHELKPIDPDVCYRSFASAKELIKLLHGIDITHTGSFFMGNISFGRT